MYGNSLHHGSVIRWTTLALLGLCFMHPTARVQAQTTLPKPAASSDAGQDAIWIDIGSPLGIVPGQTLRIPALPFNDPESGEVLR